MDFRLERACFNVYSSDYILEIILKYLDLNEQINLLRVSQRFEFILTAFLWPKICTKILLYKTPYVNIVSTVIERGEREERERHNWLEISQPKLVLSHKTCSNFLTSNARNIKVLKIHSEYYLFKKELGLSFKNIHIFTNLRELIYYRIILKDEHFQVLAENCKILQKFHLLECYNEQLTTLIPGEHFNLESLFGMKSLQELVIECKEKTEAIIKSYVVREILLNLQLKTLILKNFTIDDSDNVAKRPMGNSLEVLNMGLMSVCFWPNFLHYLNHFEQLKELSINVSDYNTTFNIQLVDILAKKCKRLEKLTLEKCDLNVEDFGVLKSIKHLSLNGCGGLTFANFQQILGALTLTTFAIINTRIYGVINHIYVSTSLEEITVDTICFTHISDAFQKSLNTFENLHTLRWLNGDINDNWIIDKCPKLQYLHIPNPYLLRRIVFTVKSLKALTFTSCQGLSWRFVLILIRNLKLERLCLHTSDTIDEGREIPQDAADTKTTLKTIIIPIGIFKMAQAFWIDLLHVNEHLHFTIYGKHEDLLSGKFLAQLIECEKFCRRVKRLEICGFQFEKF